MTPGPMRWPRMLRLALLAALVIAFALRLYRISVPSLSYDEAVSIYLARMPLAQMVRWTASDVQPPLYYLLLKGWVLVAGASEFSLRFLSLLFSVTAVALVYALGKAILSANAGAVAALVAAINPWYIWHAQDARMYSLLLALSLLSTYLLLRWLRRPAPNRVPLLLALSAACVAALYTHYLAAALFVYHFGLVLLQGQCGRSWSPLRQYLARVAMPAALLYLPWLPVVFRTYQSDTSYFQGPPKLDEILRKALTAVFVGGPGETVIENEGLRLALLLALALALLLALGWRRWRGQETVLLGMLFVPAALIFALLSVVPKFNVRYLMPASIAMPLLWAAGVSGTWERRSSISRLAAVLASLLLVLGSGYAIGSMYWDARLTRADFRSAVRSITADMKADETVLLCSGHLYPVWQYYAPTVPYVALPATRVLSVSQRLNLDVSRDLNVALAGKRGAWLLLWQDAVADPMGAVPFLLNQKGEESERDFWQVKVRHYSFPAPPSWPEHPAPQAPLSIDFAGIIRFEGLSRLDSSRLALFWRAPRHPDAEYRAQLLIRDASAHEVARLHFAPAGDAYPTNLWRPDELTFVPLSVVLPPAQPGGLYSLFLGLYRADNGQPLEVLDLAGNPQGQMSLIAKLELPGTTAAVDVAAARDFYHLQPRSDTWGSLDLLGAEACPALELPPGARLSLPLLLHSTAPVVEGRLEARAVWRSETGSTIVAPLPTILLPASVAADQSLIIWLDAYLPAAATPGPMSLELKASAPAAPLSGGWTQLCNVSVAAVHRDYAIPRLRWPSQARVGDAFSLLGIESPSNSLTAGQSVALDVAWQAVRTPAANYVEFVHLIGPDGRVWAQSNAEPLGGRRPTAGWLPGEVVVDHVTLQVPQDAPAGTYRLEVGMLDPETTPPARLPATDGSARIPGDAVSLGELPLLR